MMDGFIFFIMSIVFWELLWDKSGGGNVFQKPPVMVKTNLKENNNVKQTEN